MHDNAAASKNIPDDCSRNYNHICFDLSFDSRSWIYNQSILSENLALKIPTNAHRSFKSQATFKRCTLIQKCGQVPGMSHWRGI
jgi:hypothetical protein